MSTTPPDDDVATELVDLTESLARSPDASAEDFTGRRFGRFLLLRELGQGGMGRVFLAEQSGAVTRQVAIKIMRWRSPDPEHRLRFEMERQALARMRHPGIAQLFDAGATPEGELFFVMEYVRGVALNAWLSEHAPGLQTRIRILQEIGCASARPAALRPEAVERPHHRCRWTADAKAHRFRHCSINWQQRGRRRWNARLHESRTARAAGGA